MVLADVVRVHQDVLDGRVFAAAEVISKGLRVQDEAGVEQVAPVVGGAGDGAVSDVELREAVESLVPAAGLGFGQEKLEMIITAAQCEDLRNKAQELLAEAETNAELRARENKRRLATWANRLGRVGGEGPTFVIVFREADREAGEAVYLGAAPTASGGLRFVVIQGFGRDHWPAEFSELPKRCRIWRWRGGGAMRSVDGLNERQAAVYRRIGRGVEYGWQINEANARLRRRQRAQLEAVELEDVQDAAQVAAGEVDVWDEEIIEALAEQSGELEEDVAGDGADEAEPVEDWTPVIEVEGIEVDDGRLNQWRYAVRMGLTPIAKDLGIRHVKLVIAEEDDHCDILVFWKMGEDDQEAAVSVPINGMGSRREALQLIRKDLGQRVQ